MLGTGVDPGTVPGTGAEGGTEVGAGGIVMLVGDGGDTNALLSDRPSYAESEELLLIPAVDL